MHEWDRWIWALEDERYDAEKADGRDHSDADDTTESETPTWRGELGLRQDSAPRERVFRTSTGGQILRAR